MMPMDTAVFVSPRIRKVLRWVEWFVIIHCWVATVTFVAFEHSLAAYSQLGLFVSAVTALSFFFPVNRPLWQRRGYIALEMLPLVLIATLPINDFLFFELFVLKACFLLPRRDVIIGTVASASLLLGQIIWQLPELIERSKIHSAAYLDQPGQVIIFELVFELIVGCTFVVLCGVVFAAEQRSRHKAELLTQEVEVLATNLERTRIARDIHDSLGHSLTTLDVQLALAERYSQSTSWDEENQAKLRQSIKTAQQLTTQCLTEARQSLHTMRESSFSLRDALQTLADQMRQFFVINLRVELPSNLPQQLSYQIYLMVKEGLSNVQKHAQAERVNLSVVADKQTITVTLTDDGCGFDIMAVTSGYGLQGMRERSQLLGGQLSINSTPTQGTTLKITVPINSSTDEEVSNRQRQLMLDPVR